MWKLDGMPGRSIVLSVLAMFISASASAGQDGGQCDWLSAVAHAQVIGQKRGTRCGSRDSFEIDVQNISSQRLKIIVHLQQSDGKWSKMPDGTFDEGSRPGEKHNFYTCHATGHYKVAAMPISMFKSNRCRYPDYQGR